MKYEHNYDDIINLPHHKSNKHPTMSLYARSAQFAPFSALTGYEDMVKEKARETGERIEIDEEQKSILDSKLQLLSENLNNKLEISVTYFIPDEKKNGGSYCTITGVLKKINNYNQCIYLADNTEISIKEIIDISCNIFENIF